MPGVQKRLAELDHLMTQEGFWGNREKAQGLIDEANALRKKTEPVLKAERQMEDFKAMLELSQEEPPAEQPKHEADMERDLAQFTRELDSLELKVFLNGPHDKNNCILSINAAGWRHGGLRLGRDAPAHVSALVRRARLGNRID